MNGNYARQQQQGSALLMVLIFSGLLTMLLVDLLTNHRLESMMLHNQYYSSVAFQGAEEGLYLGYQQLPIVGTWHARHMADIHYATQLLWQDQCQRKTFQIKANGEFHGVVIKLAATVKQASQASTAGCPSLSYHWRWWQRD